MMQDTDAQRANMVATQLRTNDVTDIRIRAAMLEIPRERFVPASVAPVAYMEGCLDAGRGRMILDARSFAKMLQLAAIRATDRILDVGCATGYSTAVLARLGARVLGLEEEADLARAAEENLAALGVGNANIVRASLRAGHRAGAPYDVIVLNGAADAVPDALLDQLGDGGRLVAILREGAAGHARLYVRHGHAISDRDAFDAQVPVLPGFAREPGFVF
jgi:protein-L-isoaspartate(D-aspartate) O-methyltransferase